MTPELSEGDFVYVSPAFEEVQEGEVIAVGERYEVRLLASGETRSVSSNAVWSAPNNPDTTNV